MRCYPRRSSAPVRTRAGSADRAVGVWWTARCSLIKRRQHLLTECEALLRELPLELVEQLPSSKRVRPRLAALADVTAAGALIGRPR